MKYEQHKEVYGGALSRYYDAFEKEEAYSGSCNRWGKGSGDGVTREGKYGFCTIFGNGVG